jgi:hypothetical protein
VQPQKIDLVQMMADKAPLWIAWSRSNVEFSVLGH